jgi:hypothetical protein
VWGYLDKPIKNILETMGGGEVLLIDVATEQMF